MAQRLLDALVLVAALLDHGALVLAEPLPAGDGDDGAGRLGGGLPVGVLGARERREEQRDVPGCVGEGALQGDNLKYFSTIPQIRKHSK